MAKSSQKRSSTKANEELQAKAPEALGVIQWFSVNGWKHKRLILIAIVSFAGVTVAVKFFNKFVDMLIFWQPDKIVATVVEFNQVTSALTIQINNRTERTATIKDLFYTISAEDNVPLKLLPMELQKQISVFDKFVIQIPVGAGYQITNKKLHLIVFLSSPNVPVLIAPGIVVTNLAPIPDSFRNTCDQFVDGTPLHFGLHFTLLDDSGKRHEVDLDLGSFSVMGSDSTLQGSSVPRTIRLLPSRSSSDKDSMEMFMQLTNKAKRMPSADGKYIFMMRNLGPFTSIMTVGDNPEELVPLLFVNNKIQFGLHAELALETGDVMPTNMLNWVISSDGGITRLDLVAVASNLWSDTTLPKTAGVHYQVPLTNFKGKILLGHVGGGFRWGTIKELGFDYALEKHGWVKLFPRQEFNISNLNSNWNKMANSTIEHEPGWTRVEHPDQFIQSNKSLLVVGQNEFSPGLSPFSNAVFHSVIVPIEGVKY